MIYLDHAATSPPRREVLEAVWPYLTQVTGNPSSSHEVGRAAKAGLDAARYAVAEVLGARPGEVVFTSGGTEADNLAITGIATANPRGRHVVVSTGTASGKSLAYQLPALSAAAASRHERGRRGASTLYLAPTKALAHDQLESLRGLGLDTRVTTCDGDSSRDERRRRDRERD